MLGNRDYTLFLPAEQSKYKTVEDAFQVLNGANPHAVSTTRQNVIKAREGLHKKGFISFTTGTSKGNYAQYSIIDCTTQFTVQTTDELTDKVTDSITGELTESLPRQVRVNRQTKARVTRPA